MNQIKDSSRSITSPAGTADAMETLAPVALDSARMRAVPEREGGCIVWGGAAELSPADEIPAPRDATLAMLLAVSANTLAKAAGALAGSIQYAVRVGGSLLLVVLAMWLPFWLAYQPAFITATTRS